MSDEPTPIHDELRRATPLAELDAPELAELDVAEFDPFPGRLTLLGAGALSGVLAAIVAHLLGVWFG